LLLPEEAKNLPTKNSNPTVEEINIINMTLDKSPMPNELKYNPVRRTSLDDIKVIDLLYKPTPKEIKKARRFYEIAAREYKDDQYTDALFNIQKSIN
jgi:tetratricopeptide (TPR) repeat protein